MAAAEGPICLLLLLLLTAAGRGVSGQQVSAANHSSDGREPAESPSWAGGADGTAETTAAAAEDVESRHVMRVAAADKRRHHQQDISPEEASSAELPDLPRLVALAMERLEAGTACGDDSRAFLRALHNFTLWAVQMYDASVRAPSGVLYGSVYQLGHFDQCVLVSGMGGRVRGQYCLPEVEVRPLPDQPQPLPQDPYSQSFQQDQSAWLKIQFDGDRLKIRRDLGWWAVCVPASCSPGQVQRALDAALRVAGPRMRVQLRAHLREDYCSTGVPLQPGRATVAFVCVVAVLLVLTAIGSYYDAHQSKNDIIELEKRKGFGRQIVECFSVQRNFRLLIATNKANMNHEVFGFIRTLLMMCNISVHRFLLYGGFPLYNGEDEDKLFRRLEGMLLANGILVVNMYFTIGAMSLINTLFQHFDKGAKFHHLFLAIINRYVRLTPLQAVVILFHCGVLPYMGSGPFWKSTVLREQARCASNWWTNVLYINNYVDAANICIFQSWYMSVDFHLFIVGLFLSYLIWRWPVVGWATMGSVTIISMVPPILTIYLQNLDPLMKPFPYLLKDFRDNKEFQKLYVPSHNRATPYLIGVTAGILVYHGQNLKWKMNEVMSYVLFITVGCINFALLFSAYIFFIPGRSYNKLEATIYTVFNHSVITVVICIYGALPVISRSKSLLNFLSWKMFVILGRLSFAAYMIHTIPLLYDQGSLRQPRYVRGYSIVWLATADWCIIYPMAAMVFVLLESPFRGIMKVLLQRVK